MRYELHRPGTAGVIPLVSDVEALDRSRSSRSDDRDEAIIQLLREKLKGRNPRNGKDTEEAPKAAAAAPGAAQGEDKYEPQRLSRKILWQYDSTAHKVPLLRRHYI